MFAFLALTSAIVTLVVMPTITPFKVLESKEDSITLSAFEKNFDAANIYAKGYCGEKDKVQVLNKSESRDYKIVTTLHEYQFDCK
jgi:Zn-dependent peptidase ImmA (M78 family)